MLRLAMAQGYEPGARTTTAILAPARALGSDRPSSAAKGTIMRHALLAPTILAVVPGVAFAAQTHMRSGRHGSRRA